MLALSRKHLILLFALVVIVALAISMAAIHAANPALWHQFLTDGPQIISRF